MVQEQIISFHMLIFIEYLIWHSTFNNWIHAVSLTRNAGKCFRVQDSLKFWKFSAFCSLDIFKPFLSLKVFRDKFLSEVTIYNGNNSKHINNSNSSFKTNDQLCQSIGLAILTLIVWEQSCSSIILADIPYPENFQGLPFLVLLKMFRVLPSIRIPCKWYCVYCMNIEAHRISACSRECLWDRLWRFRGWRWCPKMKPTCQLLYKTTKKREWLAWRVIWQSSLSFL